MKIGPGEKEESFDSGTVKRVPERYARYKERLEQIKSQNKAPNRPSEAITKPVFENGYVRWNCANCGEVKLVSYAYCPEHLCFKCRQIISGKNIEGELRLEGWSHD